VNGRLALDAVAAELPDAILSDRARPNGGRTEAAQRRRENLMMHAFPPAELVARVCALFDMGGSRERELSV
jgi:hypothetical protein